MMSSKPAPTFDYLLANEKLPVLVDFWAQWCGPCLMMNPVIKAVAEHFQGRLKVIKINIDKKPELAQRFNIQSIPTLMLFYQGRELMTLNGAMPYPQLIEKISQRLPN